MSISRSRLACIAAALFAGIACVIVRLFDVQVLNGKKFAEESRRQTHQRVVIPARRGAILDRMGRPLAVSADAAAGQPPRLPFRKTHQSHTRLYPYGALAGSVLGYIGDDGYGLGGAEYAFERILRGQDGWSIFQRNGVNKRYARIDMPQKAPQDGGDVYLTIDVDVQKIVETVLRQTVRELNAKGGMCIVMEPSTGDILAMANEPGFDPNHAARYSLAERTNRCISYNFEPGSTFKLITAASALDCGIKAEDDTIDGNMGVYEIYTEKIRDRIPFGKLSFTEAMSVSSNVCFARIADQIGSESLFRYARDFGMGAKTAIELPGEEAGIVHPLDRWSGRTRVTMAIGQEVSATLLQMALAFGAVANDGVLVSPRICAKIAGKTAHASLAPAGRPVQVRRVVSSETARRLRAMLTQVVAKGTGREAALAKIAVAGKTGTSQKIDEETGEYSQRRVAASFIGFLPADNPVLLCAVMIDEPEAGQGGGAAAAPAFRKIVTQIISNPDLEFAERIIDRPPAAGTEQTDPEEIRRRPDVCGMKPGKSADLLGKQKIAEIIGAGSLIRRPSSEAGKPHTAGVKLPLYASEDAAGKKARESMPDCVGQDLRDALNALNVKGFSPRVAGSGTVYRQVPPAGAIVQPADACSLYCAFEG